MVTNEIGPHQELLERVKTRKLKGFGHSIHADGLAKTCLQGTVTEEAETGVDRGKMGRQCYRIDGSKLR